MLLGRPRFLAAFLNRLLTSQALNGHYLTLIIFGALPTIFLKILYTCMRKKYHV